MSRPNEALFHRDGELFVPTDLCRGPWSVEAQHGGPPAALLAQSAESFGDGAGMFVTRLTVELLRPVPLAPLRVKNRFLRPGRKAQLVEAALLEGDTEVARATALRLRLSDLPIDEQPAHLETPPGPEAGSESKAPWHHGQDQMAFHSHAVEHRFVGGSFASAGPATDWIRLRVPLVAGERTSALSRVAAAADFGNGISWVLSREDRYQFINPDLTVYLHRYPVGEWVCLEAASYVQPHGVGLAESRLWDEQGVIGRSLQSLLLERT